jgi:excisionase family DNA binding protein
MRPPPSASPLPADAVTVGQAAELLHCAPCSVWRRIKAGAVRGWRVGWGKWLLSRAEVLSLIRMNDPAPEALGRAELAARAEETDAVLRREGVRR